MATITQTSARISLRQQTVSTSTSNLRTGSRLGWFLMALLRSLAAPTV